jgi:choline monooxygenase
MSSVHAPSRLYTDRDVFEREQDVIFARSWQFIGLEIDLAKEGDYLADVVAKYPVVVVRDQHGQLQAFHNVCRHRAGPLVADGKGRCSKAFVCRYHAWRYTLDGNLTDTGEFPQPEEEAGRHLFPVKVAVWRGLVFVNLDPDAKPLADMLAPLDTYFSRYRPMFTRIDHSHSVASNWKVYIENYIDGYHQEGLHPALATNDGDQRHPVTIEGEVAFAGTGRAEDGFWAWVWPNLGFWYHRSVLMIERIRPVSETSTRLDHIYLHQPEDPGVDAVMSVTERNADEDAWVCERVQRNLRAGIFTPSTLSSVDGGVGWFQQRILSLLG